MAVAAPVIVAEMNDWVALGGRNLGIVGDANHTYGFHRAANEVGPGDYSRARDPKGPNGPYPNWGWACAGDFGHGGDERLRAMHRRVLARLMAGELPMICEFIGQPWAGQPVYYWARWNGITTLQRYTGAGHDTWSHISWYRSMADQRAYLWTEDDMTPQDIEEIVLSILNGSNHYGYLDPKRETDPHRRNLAGLAADKNLAAVERRLTERIASLEAKLTTGGADVGELAARLAPAVADVLAQRVADAVADRLAERLAE